LRLDQFRELEKILEPEVRAACRDRDEGDDGSSVSPARGQRPQAPGVVEEDSILAPRLAVREQLEAPAEQRVVRVGHAEESLRIGRMRRS